MSGRVDERRRARGAIDPVREKRALDLLEAGGLIDSRVDQALRRAAEDAAAQRAAFRARWIDTGAPTSVPDEPELMIKVGVLFERIGEVVRDLEEGVSGLTEVSLVDALSAIDTLDERQGDIERWLRAVAAQQGVTVPAAGEGVRS